MFNRIKQPRIETPSLSTPKEMPTITMTVKELAEELHISLPTAYMLTKKDGFPSFGVGQRIIIDREGFTQWIKKQCAERNV